MFITEDSCDLYKNIQFISKNISASLRQVYIKSMSHESHFVRKRSCTG